MATKQARVQHVHKLKLVTHNFTSVWRCMTGHCSYTLYRAQEIFLVGKATICWTCGSEFRMDIPNLEEEFPTCYACKNPDVIEVVQKIDDDATNKELARMHMSDLELEIERLRDEMTGDIDDDILRQIAEQNIAHKSDG